MVSGAQVAYHYNYTLEQAMALSPTQRQLLLRVVVTEQDAVTTRWERALGILWSFDDLEDLMSQGDDAGGGRKKEAEKSHVRIPLALAISGEFFKSLAETQAHRSKERGRVEREAGTTNVQEIAHMSTEEAKKLMKDWT